MTPSSSRPLAATSARSALSTKSKRPAAARKKATARPAARKKAIARPAAARKAATARKPATARPARKKAPAARRRPTAARGPKPSALTHREKQATVEEMERYVDAGMSLEPDELRWWVGLEALVIGGRKGIERLSRATRYSPSDIRAIIDELKEVVQQKGASASFRASIREARELRKAHRKRWASAIN